MTSAQRDVSSMQADELTAVSVKAENLLVNSLSAEQIASARQLSLRSQRGVVEELEVLSGLSRVRLL